MTFLIYELILDTIRENLVLLPEFVVSAEFVVVVSFFLPSSEYGQNSTS